MNHSVGVGKPDNKDLDQYLQKQVEGLTVYVSCLFDRIRSLTVKICIKDTANGKQLYTQVYKAK